MNKSGGDSESSGSEAPCLSPLGKSRYGRTRKPKISEDFCNIDDLFNDSQKVYRSPQKSPVPKTAKNKSSPLIAKALEIDSLFMPKQIQPLPKPTTPQRSQLDNLDIDIPKVISVPLKERKFFKSNTEVAGGEGVDVTEVLKIIKSDPNESPLDNPKPVIKTTLRTYGNKRKLTNSKNDIVVESFALPDNPIVPAKTEKEIDSKPPDTGENKPLPVDSIDMQEENDINNCTLKLNYNVVFDEMCIKAEECILKGASVNKDEKLADEKVENKIVNGVKERKRKKLSLINKINEPPDNLHVSKKSKLNQTDTTVILLESNNSTEEMGIVSSNESSRKRKRGRPRKDQNKSTRSNQNLDIPTPEIVCELNNAHGESEFKKNVDQYIKKNDIRRPINTGLKGNIKKKLNHKIKKIGRGRPRKSHNKLITQPPENISTTNNSNAENIESLFNDNIVDKLDGDIKKVKRSRRKDNRKLLLQASHIQSTLDSEVEDNVPKHLERECKKSNKTEEEQVKNNETQQSKNSITEVTSIEKQIKQEMVSVSNEEQPPEKPLRKVPKRNRFKFNNEFVPTRNLRSSVIIVEQPTEIVDLTVNDAEESNGEEKLGKNESCVIPEKNRQQKVVEKADESMDFLSENCKTVKIKEEPVDMPNVKTTNDPNGYSVGDLMWARIGTYPYWPAMLCYEPDSEGFRRVRNMGHSRNASVYHVRFFGDKGRRAWVLEYCLFPFTAENDLDILGKTAPSTTKSAYKVPPAQKPKWKIAVNEALSLLNKTTEERNDFFFNMFASRSEKRKKLVGIAEKTRINRIKIKIKKEKENVQKVPPRSKRNVNNKISKVIKNEVAASECSLSDTDTSSKFSVNSTNSWKAQAALYRRNNIFKGMFKGHVCEICEKKENVLKCKDCYGYFHADCIREVEKEDVSENKEENVTEPSYAVIGTSSPNASSQKISLAEQIDIKMKEIMKKFDYKSVYADSASDSGCSEDSGTEKGKEFSKPEVPEKKIIQHVTADCITFTELEKQPKSSSENYLKLDESRIDMVSSAEDTQNTKTFKCVHCRSNGKPPCFICNKTSYAIKKCSLNRCGKVYHIECVNIWPQTRSSSNDSFICPMHVCHTCVSDDPRGACSRNPTENLVRCIKCPSTYHSSSYCIPAGTIILSTKQVVCIRHVQNTKLNKTVNTTWCFLCSLGGDLVCCETCPTSVHLKCLKIELSETDKYICDDCESGRYPLYDEIVWVKMGKYRWWPAVILFPNEVPDTVNQKPHAVGEFVVRFFGTHDHHWVSRGRVFLFEEGDQEHMGRATRKMDLIFRKAVEEAIAAFQVKQSFKTAKEAAMQTNLKPPAYIRIKSNKPVGNVRQFDGNTSNATACECDSDQPFPCGPDSYCLNRLLLTECDPNVCPAGNRCNNQRFEKREYPPLMPYKTQGRGWGLKTLAPIKKGQFVVEYVGELIDDQEYQRRIQKMHEQKEENYYFLTIDNNRKIDAGPKGNVARFMNHSCQPNCETQKWTVNGDTRVGLFASEDIPAGAELTFNYNLECVGKEKKICKCGAPNCSGFIGVKAKSNTQEEVQKKPKRILRKKKSPPPREPTESEKFCFVCNKSGDVMGCHNKVCNNYYHLECVALKEWPDAGKWVCPWHNCNICAKRTIRCCVRCLNSYCPSHSEGYIRHDRLLGFVCFEHDPTREFPTADIVTQQPDASLPTEENDIDSTAPDERDTKDEEKEDDAVADDFTDLPSSTPLKKPQDRKVDGDVSQTSEHILEKRKRGRKKKKNRRMQHEVKILPVRAAKNLLNNSSLTIQNEVRLTSTVPTRHLRATKRASDTATSEVEKFLKRQQFDFENNLPIRKRSRARCETSV